MNKSGRARGRPSGRTTARADILRAARQRFLSEGYPGATLRAIAEDAGVDVALINYHYGSKRDLFSAALGLSVNPGQLIGLIMLRYVLEVEPVASMSRSAVLASFVPPLRAALSARSR